MQANKTFAISLKPKKLIYKLPTPNRCISNHPLLQAILSCFILTRKRSYPKLKMPNKTQRKWKMACHNQKWRGGHDSTDCGIKITNGVGDEAEKKTAFANTRITDQQNLKRVIITVAAYNSRNWTHLSFVFFLLAEAVSVLFHHDNHLKLRRKIGTEPGRERKRMRMESNEV